MSFHRTFADNTNPSSVASRLRRKRFKAFRRLAEALEPPVTVLDVGGTPTYWRMVPDDARRDLDITLVNLSPYSDLPDGIKSVSGDARDLRDFGDGSFDIVFSNSVIEHVGDRDDQEAMAREIRRVGRSYYVQTPNRYFPFEPHFQFPLFQFLPDTLQAGLVRRLDLGWYKRIANPDEALAHVRSIRLLTRRQLQGLFPDGTLVTERFLGLAKSFMMVRAS